MTVSAAESLCLKLEEETRTLFLTRYAPYPPSSGAPLRNWQNINALMLLGPVAVFSISGFKGEAVDDSELPPGLTLWKHHKLDTFTQPRSMAEKFSQWLISDQLPGSRLLTDVVVSEKLKSLIQEFKPNLVIFEELWLYAYLPVVKEFGCRVILDNHNIEGPLYLDKQSQNQDLLNRIKISFIFQKIKTIEHRFANQANQVWLCSQADAEQFLDRYETSTQLCVVPNGVDVNFYSSVRLGNCHLPRDIAEDQQVLLFIGRYSYTPNAVAARLLLEQIFPKLQRLYPDCLLVLVGASPTQQMLATSQSAKNIWITDFVSDVRPYLALSTAVIVPLIDGGGTRLKILEAFASGRPVVSTTKGAEGLNVEDGKQILIRDSVDELVKGIGDLWSDSDHKGKLIERAYELVKNNYSWEANARAIIKNLKFLQQ
ncbi:GDP-mannose-dependent alpha-(1-6)-phosphatidylinositol monomannoside mannosyltransferase [Acaryochloris thomasi RCC1774]|uniref:GDP-mannose-dependent alpha-(1-6)-phosphatidylinositol monomannoside mannosyltransferase n=1 Tax=Acaryochloris thomasi RCC1774 TaxID=1764569 RepID=A0A2W1K0M5_9CYAN|nr:glycosyltransferase family 4 protein [Acaryochloris thomasi]PZD74161.1 GDP-mannose-dependent alpha-(1-6)-phosphatidylinositol monomannoside mannosyltransferase [Acaryochloris thomasi RCC1774]